MTGENENKNFKLTTLKWQERWIVRKKGKEIPIKL